MVAISLAAWHALKRFNDSTVDIQELILDSSRSVRISAKLQPGRAAMYYQIKIDGQATHDPVFFATANPTGQTVQFVFHKANEGELIGIAQGVAPTQILILHDYAANTSWPTPEQRQVTEQAQELLDRLRQENEALDQNLVDANKRKLIYLTGASTQPDQPKP